MTPHLRESTPEDCYVLAPILREEDVAEILAASGKTPIESLLDGYWDSEHCWTMIGKQGEIVGMFGVVGSGEFPDVGVPWMLCSEGLLSVQMTFLRKSRLLLEALQTKYRVLTNLADARNIVHLKWLRWIGFEFLETYEHNGTTFVRFMKTRSNHV